MQGWEYTLDQLPPDLEMYRLVELFHCPPSVVDEQPMALCRRLLAIQDAVRKGEKAAQERANRG